MDDTSVPTVGFLRAEGCKWNSEQSVTLEMAWWGCVYLLMYTTIKEEEARNLRGSWEKLEEGKGMGGNDVIF